MWYLISWYLMLSHDNFVLCHHFQCQSKSFWGHYFIILGSSWGHLVIILGLSWDYFRVILGSFWDHLVIMMGSFWNHLKQVLKHVWEHFTVFFWSLNIVGHLWWAFARSSETVVKNRIASCRLIIKGITCDWLTSNYETRKEARAGEIESLKAAKAVLSGADYSLLQIPPQLHQAPEENFAKEMTQDLQANFNKIAPFSW